MGRVKRKRYFEPDGGKLPKATLFRLRRTEAGVGATNQAAPDPPNAAESVHTSRNVASTAPSTSQPQQNLDTVVASDVASDEVPAGLAMDSETSETPVAAEDTHAPREDVSAERLGEWFLENLEQFSVPFISSGSLTLGDAFMMLMDYALEADLSYSNIEKLLKLVNGLVQASAFPESKYLFRKFCGISMSEMTFHFYCPVCMTIIAKSDGELKERKKVSVQCPICDQHYKGPQLVKDGCFFISMPIRKQLASLLSSKTISSALHANLKEISSEISQEPMTDITDGALYRKKRQDLCMSDTDFTLTFNSDGSPMFNSSKYSIWPVQLSVNELPPLLRFKNVLMPILWYGASKPDMTMLLQAFADGMETLNNDGIHWRAGDEAVHSKVFGVCCCADAPARAAMQETTQYNGYFGCNWCYHPGACVGGTVKYPVDGGPSQERSHKGMVRDMVAASEEGARVHGVKGLSPLVNVRGFDIVWSFSPDFMHCVLLGVAKQLTELWFTTPGEPYYIGEPGIVAVIDGRLCSIRPPQSFTRLPRSLTLRKYWKAAEWQHWLLYYSVPCLQGILPDAFLEHLSLLVSGIFALLQDKVTSEDVERGTQLLVEFVVKMQMLYTEQQMTYNVHQLLHLPKCVVLLGPLWAHSCFSFESNMGKLLKLATSANGVPLQIMARLMLKDSITAYKAVTGHDTARLISRGNGLSSLKNVPVPLGKPKTVDEPIRRFVLETIEHADHVSVSEYDRMSVSNVSFHSGSYQRQTKTDCTAIRLPDGSYAKIEQIIGVTGKNIAPELFVRSHVYHVSSLQGIPHIKVARKRPQIKLYKIDMSIMPCIFMKLENRVYFCNLVNRYEWS